MINLGYPATRQQSYYGLFSQAALRRKILETLIGIRPHSQFIDYQLVIAGAPGISPDQYAPYLQDRSVKVVWGKTYRLLQQSRVALVTSGTATLETALLRVPQVVCYRLGGGKLFYKTFEKILKVPYVSLVNLIADSPVVCELLGYRATPENLRRELSSLFEETTRKITRNKSLTPYALQ